MRNGLLVAVLLASVSTSAIAGGNSNNNGPTFGGDTTNNITNQGGAGGDGGTGIGIGGNASAAASASSSVKSYNTNFNSAGASVRSSNRNDAHGGSGGNATINTPAYQGVNYGGGYSVRTVGVPNAPALAPAGIESCMSSMSLGSGFMGGSAALGFPVMDKGCDARLFSRTMANLGLRTAAVQMLCHDERAAAALATNGIACAIRDSQGGVNLFSGLFGAQSAVRDQQPAVQAVSYQQVAPTRARVETPAVRPVRTGGSWQWSAFHGYQWVQ